LLFVVDVSNRNAGKTKPPLNNIEGKTNLKNKIQFFLGCKSGDEVKTRN
jgi:hypothetical protein